MKKIIIIIVFGLILFSCKKKDDAPTEANTSSNPTGDYGTFTSVYNFFDFGSGSIFEDSTIQAKFYDTPNVTKTNISAGTVSVNTTALTMWTGPIVYNKMNGINMQSLSWQISGSGTIAATSFSYAPSYPKYSGQSALQDTVTKSMGFTLNINGISNTNQPTYITISQSGASTITKTVTGGSGTFTITPTDLSSFSNNNYLIIRLSMFNYSNISLNSKTYGINANRTHEKSCYLK